VKKLIIASLALTLIPSAVLLQAGVKLTIENNKTPIAWCPAQEKNTTTSTRPKIPLYGTTAVADFNEDGVLDGLDIQRAIDRAQSRQANQGGGMQRVLLVEQDRPYLINESIILPSRVFLDGNGQRLLVNRSADLNDVIRVEQDAVSAGIYDVTIHANEAVLPGHAIPGLGIINILPGASGIFIYDNLLVNDRVENRDSIGNTTAATGVNVGNDNSRIYIDGNIFSHVPSGIRISGDNASRIRVTHNIFDNWRVRAIYVRGSDRPHHDLVFAHNRILEPKVGTVRQPIAFHAGKTGANYLPTYNVRINDNYLRGDDVPHVAERILQPDGTTQRVTTSTNGTADMISLHNVENFNIARNCLLNPGESGIIVTNGSKDGVIINNYVENADTTAIGIGANLGGAAKNIEIKSNHLLNPGRNRDQHSSRWAFAGITVIKGEEIEYSRNRIIETKRLLNDEGEAYTLAYGVSVWANSDAEVTEQVPNVYDFVDPEVIERGVSR